MRTAGKCGAGQNWSMSDSRTAPTITDDIAPPDDGFGRLWRKQYWIELDLPEISPEQILADWRDHFDAFWPGDNRLYAELRKLRPLDLAEMDIEVAPGARITSGVVLLYSRPDAFALITPKGHMFNGVITFGVRSRDRARVAEIDIRMRASDPLFEIGMALFGHRQEDRFWTGTLHNLGLHWQQDCHVHQSAQVVDRHRHWNRAINVWHNAAIRSLLGRGATRVRAILRREGQA